MFRLRQIAFVNSEVIPRNAGTLDFLLTAQPITCREHGIALNIDQSNASQIPQTALPANEIWGGRGACSHMCVVQLSLGQ